MKKTAKAMGISNPASGRNFIKAIIKKEIVSPLSAIKLTLSHFPKIFLFRCLPLLKSLSQLRKRLLLDPAHITP